MNEKLKIALYVVGVIVIFIGLFLFLCNGCLNSIVEIGKDLGVGERLP